MTITLHHGCSYEVLRSLIARGVRVHSVICDPPYFLESIARRFGSATAAAAQFGDDGAFTRAGMRFTGKTWDAADEQGRRISFDPEFWQLIFELLLPGGYVAAFASPRTGHWQAVAMELAGFTIHPFKGWAYDSGLPKPHPADKAFKRLGGTPEEIVQWAGWSYGAQAEKPALEPIYIGQRPFDCRNGPENLRAHGVGAINIAASRVPTEDGKGYHPANLVHDGSDLVLAELGDSAKFFHAFEQDPSLIVNAKASRDDRAGSEHPSVKPVRLLRNLARMYTPPGGTVLDPFAGSGTTAEAARAEGFDCILVERDPEYVSDIVRRFGIVSESTQFATLDGLI
ncbi:MULTISPECIES: site-specific DNA-methyltransferase [unclassified Sphingopyxis]|uniref:site-specific DNA-methyltransferase n=1 Tax=unclassified Sphingopyxis TaxID=2614943 RepID=UPI002857BEE4|nr:MULTISPECIES: site-specific DNA-methyltransferase [unclassified Sphingopyxis]MDR7061997.1 site-specific DNA-methyltransferase (adenine-specific) [Sphingopyxis sp. BE235]MDR7182456.1 site-specific DNA-methyltransferase (adenine-specific) [Sphingopyxis sp. BE249]